MTRVIATIDEEGRLSLPEELREQFKGRTGEQISVEVEFSERPVPGSAPFENFIGILPPLPGGSLEYIRRMRGHDEYDDALDDQ